MNKKTLVNFRNRYMRAMAALQDGLEHASRLGGLFETIVASCETELKEQEETIDGLQAVLKDREKEISKLKQEVKKRK